MFNKLTEEERKEERKNELEKITNAFLNNDKELIKQTFENLAARFSEKNVRIVQLEGQVIELQKKIAEIEMKD